MKKAAALMPIIDAIPGFPGSFGNKDGVNLFAVT
jgi:hypothetical protein